MTTSRIAFLDKTPGFAVREDRGDYDDRAADSDRARHLCKAQARIGEALNLAGLVLKSLDDEGDARAMQIHAALTAIEKKLKKALGRIDRHEARLARGN